MCVIAPIFPVIHKLDDTHYVHRRVNLVRLYHCERLPQNKEDLLAIGVNVDGSSSDSALGFSQSAAALAAAAAAAAAIAVSMQQRKCITV